MIQNDQEYRATFDRIAYFHEQIARLRRMETNSTNYRLSASGYFDELDRMNLAVRAYLWLHPAELADAVPTGVT